MRDAGGGYGYAQLSHSTGMLLWLTGLMPASVFALMTAPDSATMRAELRASCREMRDWQRTCRARHFALATKGLSVRSAMREALGPTARDEETLTEFVDRTLGPRVMPKEESKWG